MSLKPKSSKLFGGINCPTNHIEFHNLMKKMNDNKYQNISEVAKTKTNLSKHIRKKDLISDSKKTTISKNRNKKTV